MKKKVTASVLFLILAVLLLWKLNDALSIKMADGIQNMELLYEQEEGTVDVIFYGSSHSFSGVNPAVLWEEEGISSYDLGAPVQPLWNTYYYMKESLKYQTPKVMVVEMLRVVEEDDYLSSSRTISNLFGMRLSWNKIQNVFISTRTQEDALNYLLGYPVYHTRYSELGSEDFQEYLGDPNGKYGKGYYALYSTLSFDTNPDVSYVTETGELSSKTEEYLYKIIELAEEEDIPLVFFVAPYQEVSESDQMMFNRCAEIAAEEGVPMINFNLMFDELGLDPETDYADLSHLNYKGVEKLSSWLASYLKEEYNLEDHRGDEAYSSWDFNAADWERSKADQILSEENEWDEFLETLFGDDTDFYTYVISLNGDYDNEDGSVSYKLLSLGVSEDVADNGGVWISDNGVTSFYTASAEGTAYIELTGMDVKITVSEDGILFECDGESQIRAVNGINVFVYDNYTESLVIAAGFNADNEYALIVEQ